ncbi:MAG TPA: hypothetical protein VFC78_23270 [Tepidisphaeraceae bacterium]|nr:hypothetical protein [Tepidisphaeraceae bacterium]
MEKLETDPQVENPTLPAVAPPVPLAYQAPRDRPESERPDGVARIIAGLFTGCFLLGLAGFILYIRINSVIRPADPRYARVNHWVAIAYFLCAAGIGVIIAKGAKRPGWRAAGRWFSLGNLLGAGIAMLIEGICFAAH